MDEQQISGYPLGHTAMRNSRQKAARQRKSFSVDDQVYEKQVEICKAFANSTRLKILDLLAKREHSSAELQDLLGVSKANLSQHLAILKSASVVLARREGKSVLCSLAIPEVKTACQLIRNVLRAQLKQNRQLAV
jgi:DNA-binding transcriptional ArsR family regulator